MLAGGAPVVLADEDEVDAVQVVGANSWLCSSAPRASENGEERRPERGSATVRSGRGRARCPAAQKKFGGAHEVRTDTGNLRRPKSGGGVTCARRNRRISAADTAAPASNFDGLGAQ